MITISPAAEAQIQQARQQSDAEGLALRVAVELKQDGSLHYIMGFDDNKKQGDMVIDAEKANVVINVASEPLAKGMKIDFVELEGRMEFIFINPNDPKQKPPTA
ncbi:MAG TPA: iron-sulfur cluster assembly accessory protein [Thiothrix sp.]|nr:iron-sulfur cluster assembly accessory protein [Thiothrix sp.]